MSTIAPALLEGGALNGQSAASAESATPSPRTPHAPATNVSLSLRESAVTVDAASLQILGRNGGALDQFRFQSLSAAMRSVEVTASASRFAGGIRETAGLIYRRAEADLRISSVSLERFAEQARDLENIDPDLLQDYLALIKLLDENTPESFDPFFEKLRGILSGEGDLEVPQAEGAALDVNVPVDPSAETGAQVSAFFFEVRVSVTSLQITFERRQQQSDPLVLDLDGDGIEVSDVAGGRAFDIDADGRADRTAFVTGGDAFLALDRNGNGRIDDGGELFGDQHGARDGYAELAKFDENDDLSIDARDSVFSRLSLFDGTGIRSLASAGISAIGLSTLSTAGGAIQGNPVLATGSFTKTDGSNGNTADLLLNYLG